MSHPSRIDQLSREEKRQIQADLIRLGFLAPYLPSGDPADDGIWGPVTDLAYEAYWASRPSVEISVPIVAPAPVMPWWVSRGIWGAILVVASLPVKTLTGIDYEPTEVLDVIMPAVEQIPNLMVAVGGFLAWLGRRNAKAPVDPTLMARIGGHDLRAGRARQAEYERMD